ncbi:SDR family oxidoreductase [Streptomyces sp. NPDC051315]|uniref:SDR family oxidoreductase n=1 Tax=Streptomyces sp. NPDC051315 TaxID=3365650 RepID=UPI0037A793D5
MTDQFFDFTGKVVLVTGGATGIGRAVSLAFARQGAVVVIGDIDQRSSETVNLIEKEGGRGLFVPTDVTLARDVARLVATTVDTFGDLHIAFNNAGVFVPPAPLAEQSEEDFDKVVAVDLKGEIAHMAAAGGGAIINTASIAGLIGDPDMAPYVAAKHGVIGLTKAAAVDYAKAGIRVNALAPGLTRTAMTQAWLDDPVKREIVLAGPQLGRAADPEEIVGMVLHLASPAASFTTGGVFVVDGGQTAH